MTGSAPARRIAVALCSPGEIWGGVEQLVESLARVLMQSGVPVTGIVFHDGMLRERLENANVPVTVVGNGKRYDPRTILQLKRVLQAQQINVIHTHGYKAAVLGGIAARLAGVRHVRTEHGRIEPWKGTARLKMRANGMLERAATRSLTDALVFVSRDIQEHSNGAPRSVMQEVIINGLETPAANVIASEHRLPAVPAFKVGIIGRIAPVKGHLYLLDAVKRLRHLPDLHLYVFGTGPSEDECRAFCKAADLDGVVTFVGFKSNIHDYLQQLDLLAMPSLHEGLPYTLLEAMYHKVPIVASAVGGLAEVLEDGVNALLVPAADAAALATAMEKLAADGTLRGRLAARAYQKVRDQFMIDEMARRYMNVYGRVLSAGHNA